MLSWLLESVTPTMVTLEYWKDVAMAREQTSRLNQLHAQFSAAQSLMMVFLRLAPPT